MGHSRRWSLDKEKTLFALRELAHFSKWELTALSTEKINSDDKSTIKVDAN